VKEHHITEAVQRSCKCQCTK